MTSSENPYSKTATIIGGGPVGCYLGHLLAKDGVPTTIFEDNITIGKPEQCTGIFNVNLDEFIKPKRDHVLNMVKGAMLCCGDKQVEIRSGSDKAYVYDRIKFDQYIADLAQQSGAVLVPKTRFITHSEADKNNSKNCGTLRLQFHSSAAGRTMAQDTDILIGADGPNSSVAKSAGIFGDRRYWIGSQVFLDMKKPWFDKELAYLYFDKKYHEDLFAWVVPMSETTAKVGTACYKNAASYLDAFLKDKFAGAKITGRQGGLIPYYDNTLPCQKDSNIFLVGDAAMQVKATTGGGIVNGFWAATHAHQAIIKGTYDYEKRVRPVKRNLALHLMMRNKLNKFSDADYEELIGILSQDDLQRVLRERGDNDYPHRFLFSLLWRAPSLLKFVVK